jgi:hypothetical protein
MLSRELVPGLLSIAKLMVAQIPYLKWHRKTMYTITYANLPHALNHF